MHGGAFGSGAPTGNQNAFKHGYYSRQAIKNRKELMAWVKEMRQATNGLLQDVKSKAQL